MSEELKELNPQITKVKIGVRDLRELEIYPLSVRDQLEMSDLITKALQEFFLKSDKGDIEFVVFLLDLIEKNIDRVLKLVTDVEKSEDLLSDVTNFQVSEIVMIIYTENFENPAKNVESLLDKVKEMIFQLGGPLQQSVSDTLDTDSKTSSENHSEKEE